MKIKYNMIKCIDNPMFLKRFRKDMEHRILVSSNYMTMI